MCLAVPGKIISIKPGEDDPAPGPIATADFQGSRVEVSLHLTPDAGIGDWVLVHAGFALQVLDVNDAREMWEYLQMAEMVGDMPPDLQALEPETESDAEKSSPDKK